MPGLAHFFVFWGFIILTFTIIEAVGALFQVDFAIPLIGKTRALGFLEDFFGVAVMLGIIVFAILRVTNDPARKQRDSRFYGSHTGAAWAVLGLIFLVVLTLFGDPRRSAQHRRVALAGDAAGAVLLVHSSRSRSSRSGRPPTSGSRTSW